MGFGNKKFSKQMSSLAGMLTDVNNITTKKFGKENKDTTVTTQPTQQFGRPAQSTGTQSAASTMYGDSPTVSAESAKESNVLPVKNPPVKEGSNVNEKLKDLISKGILPLVDFGFTGIDSTRPDIISLVGLNPAYDSSSKSPEINVNEVGALIDIQHNVRQLTQEVLGDFIKKASNNQDLKDLIEQTKRTFKTNINDTKIYLNALNTIFKQLDAYDDSLNIKSNEFFKEILLKLYFDQNEYIKSYNTKLLMQSLYEFRYFLKFGIRDDNLTFKPKTGKTDGKRTGLEGISVGLVNAPYITNLRQPNTFGENFNFPNSFQSAIEKFEDYFAYFKPNQEFDIIQSTFIFLNNELFCSQALGDNAVRNFILNKFPDFTSPLSISETPFDRIANFEIINDQDDLKSVEVNTQTSYIDNFSIKTLTGKFVLPFESAYIAEKQGTAKAKKYNFMPGSNYIKHGLLSGFKFNSAPLSQISDRIDNFTNSLSAIKKLFSTKDLENYTEKNQVEQIIFSEHLKFIKQFEGISFQNLKSTYDPINDENSKLIRDFALLRIYQYNFRPLNGNSNDSEFRFMQNSIYDLLSPNFDESGNIASTTKDTSAIEKEIYDMILKDIGGNIDTTLELDAYALHVHNKYKNWDVYAALNKEADVLAYDRFDFQFDNTMPVIKASILNVFYKIKYLLEEQQGYNQNNTTRFSSLNDRMLYTLVYYSYMKLINLWNPIIARPAVENKNTPKPKPKKTPIGVINSNKPDQSNVSMIKEDRFTILIQKNSTDTAANYDNYFDNLLPSFENAITKGTGKFVESSPVGSLLSRGNATILHVASAVKATKEYYELLLNYINNMDDYFSGIVSAISKLEDSVETITGTNPNSIVASTASVTALAALTNTNPSERINSVQTSQKQREAFKQLTEKIDSSYGTLYNKQQLILANKSLDLVESKIDNDNEVFVDESIATQSTLNALHSFLQVNERSQALGRMLSKDTKIVSVGVPNGFSNYYKKNVKLASDSFADTINTRKQQDVIYINVYKQNAQYSKIVFKPISFIFELSRFCLDSIAKGAPVFELTNRETSYHKIEKTIPTFNYDYVSDIIDGKKENKSVVPEKELNGSEYKFLTKYEKQGLRRNHIRSYLLNWYLKYLIGLDFDETRFTVTKAYNTNNMLQNEQLISLLSDQLGLPITQTEYLNLFSSKTILKTGLSEQLNILSPKKYERVFHIPVNPNDFIIDEQKTSATYSSHLQMTQLENKPEDQTKIINNTLLSHTEGIQKYKTIQYHPNDISLVKYWVTISSVPEGTNASSEFNESPNQAEGYTGNDQDLNQNIKNYESGI